MTLKMIVDIDTEFIIENKTSMVAEVPEGCISYAFLILSVIILLFNIKNFQWSLMGKLIMTCDGFLDYELIVNQDIYRTTGSSIILTIIPKNLKTSEVISCLIFFLLYISPILDPWISVSIQETNKFFLKH